MARSMESAPLSSPPVIETTPGTDDSLMESLDDLYNADSATSEHGYNGNSEPEATAPEVASTEEAAPGNKENFYSRTANVIRMSTEKVAAVLDTLAAGAPARQEARGERMDTARDTLKKVGRKALKGAKLTGLFTIGMTVLTAEAVSAGSTEVRTKVTELAMQARIRLDERAAHKENKRRTRATERAEAQAKAEELSMLEEAEADNEAFDENKRQEQLELQRQADAKAAEMQRQAEARAEFEAYKTELLEKRAAALARKTARKERRQEIIGNLKEKGSEVYGVAKRRAKQFGRAALKIAKRTFSAGKAAAKAAVSAGAQEWSESAGPAAPSN